MFSNTLPASHYLVFFIMFQPFCLTHGISSCWKYTQKRLLLPFDSAQEGHDAKPSLVGKEDGEWFLIICNDNIAG